MRIFVVFMLLFGFLAGQDSMFVNLDTLIIGVNSSENQEGQFMLEIEPKESDFSKTLAEKLRRQSTIDTKTYGPIGGLSTVSLRGMSASHTVFNWNGFNINSLTLGSFDFGRESMPLNGNLTVNMSPASSNYGSGTVGGVIAYQSKPIFNQGLQFSLSSSLGINDYRHLKRDSFEPNRNHQFKGEYSNEKYALSIGVLATDAPNVYVSDSIDLNTGEEFKRFTTQIEFNRKLKKGKLGLAYWGAISDNNLRPSATIPNQKDTNHRMVASLNWKEDKVLISAHAGYFKDGSLYESLFPNGDQAVFSYIGTESYRAKASVAKVYKNSSILSLTGLFRDDIANVMNYGGRVTEHQANLIARYEANIAGFQIIPVLRFEYYEVFKEQLIKSISVIKNYQDWLFRINFEDKYRVPTFNDRYWQNAGNPDLDPEVGYGGDINATWTKEFTSSSLRLNGSLFSIELDNWIQWVPGAGGNWEPISYQKVWSRGGALNLTYARKYKKIGLDISTQGSYVQTEIVENYNGEDDLIGTQLIYNPRLRGNTNVDIQYKSLKFNFGADYTSRRYTTYDNTDVWSLDPVVLFHSTLSIEKKLKRINLMAFLNIENILNNEYVWVRGYPMPGRYTQLGIQIKFKSKQK